MDRRRAHDALSGAAAELNLPELEAWHAAKAQAAPTRPSPTGSSASQTEPADRGGFASRANVLSRAAELTPEGPTRNARQIAAAEAALAAGAAQVGAELIDRLNQEALDRVQQCRVATVRASFALFTPDPAELVWGTAKLLDAAAKVHGLDPDLEQTTLIRAFEYCLPSERLTRGVTLPGLGERLRAGAEVIEGTAATIFRGIAAHILLPYADAVPVMREAVAALMRLEDGQELLRLGAVLDLRRPRLGSRGRLRSQLGRAAREHQTQEPEGCRLTSSEEDCMARRPFVGRRGRQRTDLPPGQYDVGREFPVLTAEVTPRIDTSRWTMTVDGLVEQPTTWSWDELHRLPPSEYAGPIHCVTTWSKFETRFAGVSVDMLLNAARPQPTASHVLAASTTGYTTNLPLDHVRGGQAWVVWSYDGKPLPREHGGPARLLVPHLYFWKSAKWITRLTLLDADTPGFWERNGYHDLGDPWREQRYWGD